MTLYYQKKWTVLNYVDIQYFEEAQTSPVVFM